MSLYVIVCVTYAEVKEALKSLSKINNTFKDKHSNT